MTPYSAAPSPLGRMSKVEFIVLMAMLMALNALAIDIMLPGLQQIGASLGVENENHRQFIMSSYILGFGAAQLVYGPLSDRFGRRIPMLIGIGIYIVASALCIFTPSFTGLLWLRFIQGLGAASMRVITISIVRDIYGGRQMAEAMSMIIMIFLMVPVLAPGIGQIILLFAEWHMIFIFMAASGLVIGLWTWLRLPETLNPNHVRPFTLGSVGQGFRIVLTNRVSLNYTIATSFIFGALLGFINSAQQIYTEVYQLGVWLPAAFAVVALCTSLSSFINSRLVGRFGMRNLSHAALIGYVTINLLWLLLLLLADGPLPLALFLMLFSASMFMFGLIGSNFNSLAMEPLGHLAGTASSVLGFLSTIGSAIIGAVIGQAYNGTALPLVAGFAVIGISGLAFTLIAEKGTLFGKRSNRAQS